MRVITKVTPVLVYCNKIMAISGLRLIGRNTITYINLTSLVESTTFSPGMGQTWTFEYIKEVGSVA
jgi:hypothetical protein